MSVQPAHPTSSHWCDGPRDWIQASVGVPSLQHRGKWFVNCWERDLTWVFYPLEKTRKIQFFSGFVQENSPFSWRGTLLVLEHTSAILTSSYNSRPKVLFLFRNLWKLDVMPALLGLHWCSCTAPVCCLSMHLGIQPTSPTYPSLLLPILFHYH